MKQTKCFFLEEFVSLASTWQSFKCLRILIKTRQGKEKEHQFVIPTHNVRLLTSSPWSHDHGVVEVVQCLFYGLFVNVESNM